MATGVLFISLAVFLLLSVPIGYSLGLSVVCTMIFTGDFPYKRCLEPLIHLHCWRSRFLFWLEN